MVKAEEPSKVSIKQPSGALEWKVWVYLIFKKVD